VTANNSGNNVSVLLANSLGSFDPVQTYPAGSQPQSIALANFNGDSAIDLVTANVDSGTISVLLGTGTGSFKPPVTSVVGSSPVGVAVGDFNGTGGPDLASANNGSDNVSVLLNNGIWPALDAPSITLNNASVAEGQTGTTALVFTVTLSAPSTQTVTVHYATADYSAVAGNDYVATEGTLTFLPTVTSMTIPVLVNGDRVFEYGENFYLRLSDATNAFLARATGAGNIMDDEPLVSIDYGPVSVTEGNSGTTNAAFTVRLAAPYDVPVSVSFSAVEGDTNYPGGYGYYGYYYPATAGSDFQSASNVTISFAPNETEKTILIAVNGDRLAENDEYFSVNLNSSDYGTLVATHAVGIILNDEPYTRISGGGNVAEGNSGTTALTFTISLSAAPDASNAPVTVDYATGDGSATVAGGDYQAKTGTLSFGIGETSKQVTVLVNGDRLAEYDEFLSFNLTSANGAVLSDTTGYGTIVDDEPRLSINSPRITEGDSGTKVLSFTVTLSAAYDQPVTVHYATQDGSASAGSDYVAKSGNLTFSPGGPLSQTITVTIKGDKQKESDEYFYVVLSGASSNVMIYDGYGLGTILNDEPGNGPPPGKGHGKS
jgi:hypothetical protein